MNFINKWKDKIAHYVDVRIQLAKLTVIERASNVLSYLIFVFICLFLAVTILIFLGISLGELFSGMTDSRALGYLMTTGVYLLLVVVLFLARKPIVESFAGVFVRMLTSGDDDDDEEERKNNQNQAA
jgi:hypothetical protein